CSGSSPIPARTGDSSPRSGTCSVPRGPTRRWPGSPPVSATPPPTRSGRWTSCRRRSGRWPPGCGRTPVSSSGGCSSPSPLPCPTWTPWPRTRAGWCRPPGGTPGPRCRCTGPRRSSPTASAAPSPSSPEGTSAPSRRPATSHGGCSRYSLLQSDDLDAAAPSTCADRAAASRSSTRALSVPLAEALDLFPGGRGGARAGAGQGRGGRGELQGVGRGGGVQAGQGRGAGEQALGVQVGEDRADEGVAGADGVHHLHGGGAGAQRRFAGEQGDRALGAEGDHREGQAVLLLQRPGGLHRVPVGVEPGQVVGAGLEDVRDVAPGPGRGAVGLPV